VLKTFVVKKPTGENNGGVSRQKVKGEDPDKRGDVEREKKLDNEINRYWITFVC
jgi:hypothetical protein